MGSEIVLQGIVHIKRPVEEVFHWIADYTKDRHWRAEVQEMNYMTREPIGVGSRCLEVSQVLGKRLETKTEVTEYVANEKVVCKSYEAQTPIVSYRYVREMDGGTEFEYRLDVDLSPILMFRLFKPFVRMAGQKTIDGYMQKLKQVLEAF
jgi:hypothetical protein